MINPLSIDPAFSNARARVERGDLGQLLAIYAVIRAKERIEDALITLGLPLIHELISVAGESPSAVTSAYTGGYSGFEQWSLILAFPSSVRASIDIASGLGAAQARALDLRVEWSGAEQAILVDPTAVAVTVTTGTGQRHLSAEVTPIETALNAFASEAAGIGEDSDSSWAESALIIAAIRESTGLNGSIAIS